MDAAHWVVFLSNNANKNILVQQLLQGRAAAPFEGFNALQGALFSNSVINEFIEEEERHEQVAVGQEYHRKLKSLSSGERKKALLIWLLAQKPGFIILDNPFDNLDIAAQASLLQMLTARGKQTPLVQLANRKTDALPFITNAINIDNDNVQHMVADISHYINSTKEAYSFKGAIPQPLHNYQVESNELIRFENVNVRYEERHIVNDINWTINAGEFWQLVGPNGSGKTTLLTMITGDNPKAYGQNLFLFGKRKGSGETVWEIKEKIGYLTPAMTDLFSTRHTLEEMIVSGFFDSIGLYIKLSEIQLRLADEWLLLIEMLHLKNKPFCTLSLGQQRMVLIARAMVKHPPLLILDEPTSGLDDHNVAVVTSLINKIASESSTAILYVSHRAEEGLQPQFIFQLTASENGSTGKVIKKPSLHLRIEA